MTFLCPRRVTEWRHLIGTCLLSMQTTKRLILRKRYLQTMAYIGLTRLSPRITHSRTPPHLMPQLDGRFLCRRRIRGLTRIHQFILWDTRRDGHPPRISHLQGTRRCLASLLSVVILAHVPVISTSLPLAEGPRDATIQPPNQRQARPRGHLRRVLESHPQAWTSPTFFIITIVLAQKRPTQCLLLLLVLLPHLMP